METRANYVVVGIFTLAAVLAAFAFVYWTAGLGDRGEMAQLRFRIPGSASGLARGSIVLFNGVKVGDVRRVYIDVTNPAVAIADAEIDRTTPVTASTQADLGLAGLTGTANIELRGGDPSEPNLFDLAEQKGDIAEMIANPSAVTNLLESAQNIFRRADSVLTELEGFVGDAREPLTATLRNVEQFSDALGRNADGIDTFLSSVTSLSETLSGVSGQLEASLGSVQELIDAVDRDKVASTVDNIEQITQKLNEASGNVGEIMQGIDAAVASIGEFSGSASETLTRVDAILQNVDKVVASVDPDAVSTALTNFEQASTSVNAAVNDVAKVTERFGQRAEDIDRIITDAQQLAERLNQASVRVDGVLAKVDNLLGSGEAEGVMAEAKQTLKAFREVADTLNGRIGTITDGLARFSGQGLREVEALVGDSRRAINRIEQAITDLERNPQRILSGGEGGVRQFDGRARR